MGIPRITEKLSMECEEVKTFLRNDLGSARQRPSGEKVISQACVWEIVEFGCFAATWKYVSTKPRQKRHGIFEVLMDILITNVPWTNHSKILNPDSLKFDQIGLAGLFPRGGSQLSG